MRRTQPDSGLVLRALLGLCLLSGCAERLPARGTAPRETHEALAGSAGATTLVSDAGEGAAVPVGTLREPDEEPELVEDEAPELEAPEVGLGPVFLPHPLDGWSEARIENAVQHELASLGSMSVGQPNAGALLNGMQAETSELYRLVDPTHAFGTRETLDYLRHALQKVHKSFAGTPPLDVGHISAERGGPLGPHLSHQSGRDVDISFYYSSGARWYARATEKNLDLARTWAFVRALVTETDIEMILVDHSVQSLLLRHALGQGEDAEWARGLFQRTSGGRLPIVRHAPGHATHLHVRFYNPIAQETARRAQAALVRRKILPELVSFIRHRARRGDTLAKISKRYGASVAAIKSANGLRTSRIRERRDYRIPVRARGAVVVKARFRFPARRLPPT